MSRTPGEGSEVTAMRRSELFRFFTAFVAALCVFAQGASIGHALLVQHVRCAEHGEWVHGDGVHAGAAARASAVHGESAALHAGGAATRHGHEHCSQIAERRELALPTATTVAVAVPGLEDAFSARFTDAVVRARDVYAFAPKVSPPA